jgi:hypothetical protein
VFAEEVFLVFFPPSPTPFICLLTHPQLFASSFPLFNVRTSSTPSPEEVNMASNNDAAQQTMNLTATLHNIDNNTNQLAVGLTDSLTEECHQALPDSLSDVVPVEDSSDNKNADKQFNAVQMLYDADKANPDVGPYQPVHISKRHVIFPDPISDIIFKPKRYISPISKHVGMELVIWCPIYPTLTNSAYQAFLYKSFNQYDAANLLTDIVETCPIYTGEGVVYNNFIRDLNTDTVLVARTDRKPLLPQHVEALNEFIEVLRFNTAEEVHIWEKYFQEEELKAGFNKFFEQYKTKKSGTAAEWADVPSPFEM